MTRGFYTQLIIGGIALLIIVAVACFLWYQHTIAEYEREAAETAELARQWELSQAKINNGAEQAAHVIPAKSTTPYAEKVINKITAEVENSAEMETQQQTDAPLRNATASDVSVSPFGFGPYPEVPEDWPGFAVWLAPDFDTSLYPSDAEMKFELLARVTIKLWNEGIRNFTSAKIDAETGKVYPYYTNTVYITVEDDVLLPDGTVGTHITSISGRVPPGVDLLNPPSHIKVLDYNSSGIDPFEYLDLY